MFEHVLWVDVREVVRNLDRCVLGYLECHRNRRLSVHGPLGVFSRRLECPKIVDGRLFFSISSAPVLDCVLIVVGDFFPGRRGVAPLGLHGLLFVPLSVLLSVGTDPLLSFSTWASEASSESE